MVDIRLAASVLRDTRSLKKISELSCHWLVDVAGIGIDRRDELVLIRWWQPLHILQNILGRLVLILQAINVLRILIYFQLAHVLNQGVLLRVLDRNLVQKALILIATIMRVNTVWALVWATWRWVSSLFKIKNFLILPELIILIITSSRLEVTNH